MVVPKWMLAQVRVKKGHKVQGFADIIRTCANSKILFWA